MLPKQNHLMLAVIGALLSLVFAIMPVLFIRGNVYDLAHNWQEAAFYIICIGCGALAGALGFNLSPGLKEVKRQRIVVWGSGVFFVLYLSSAVLCQKIHFAVIEESWWRTTGLLIFIFGSIIREWAILVLGRFHSGLVAIQRQHKLVTAGPYRWLRHPSYLGALISTAGVSMIFGTWFPLLALPGLFVALKWRVEDEEKLLANEFASQFDEYKQRTWRFIPFIY